LAIGLYFIFLWNQADHYSPTQEGNNNITAPKTSYYFDKVGLVLLLLKRGLPLSLVGGVGWGWVEVQDSFRKEEKEKGVNQVPSAQDGFSKVLVVVDKVVELGVVSLVCQERQVKTNKGPRQNQRFSSTHHNTLQDDE